MLAGRADSQRVVRLDTWTPADTANVRQARREYAWSWALCYLLHNNPNYAERFRTLGGDYLTRRGVSFEQLFAPMAGEINFEFGFFLQRVDVGYRVDLCRWDWHTRCRSLDDGSAVSTRCVAARGWQASGLLVTQGRTYRSEADGDWSTGADRETTDANGSPDGSGG